MWCLGGQNVANVRTQAMPASHVGPVREPGTAGAIYRQLMLVLVPISLLLLMYQEPASSSAPVCWMEKALTLLRLRWAHVPFAR